jgi:hypothetical protein
MAITKMVNLKFACQHCQSRQPESIYFTVIPKPLKFSLLPTDSIILDHAVLPFGQNTQILLYVFEFWKQFYKH